METERQREILRQLGCARMQGFLIAEPIPGDLVLTWLEGRSRRRTA